MTSSLCVSEDRVRRLISLARARYALAAVMKEQVEAVKAQYSFVRYRVNSLASAPAATSLSDLPADVANALFSAASEANNEVKRLRKTVAQLLTTLHKEDETVLAVPSEAAGAPQTDDVAGISRKSSNEDEGREASIDDSIASELRAACDTYETARQLIVSEMEDCDRVMRLALSEVETADEDEVLFSARGELVTASRSSLLRTEGTYFYGLLNRGSWLTDAIGAHSIDDDSTVLNMVMESLVDRPSFVKHVRELDACTRNHLTTRLDYYQAPVLPFGQFRANSYIEAEYDDILREVKMSKTADNYIRNKAIWDPSIHRYSVAIDASTLMAISIGFAPANTFDISKGMVLQGWYFFLFNGALYSHTGVSEKAYNNKCKVGDLFTCIYDDSSKEISFERNGVPLGVAYSNIIGEDIAPAVMLYCIGDRITLSRA